MSDHHRLPSTLTPSRYEIEIVPDLKACTFVGVETIAVAIPRPLSEIVLHAKELTFSSAELVDGAGTHHRLSIELIEEDAKLPG